MPPYIHFINNTSIFPLLGAASLNAKMNGMIALRTIVFFLTTSLISALIGLALVLAIHPGSTETKSLLGDGNTEDRKVGETTLYNKSLRGPSIMYHSNPTG